MKLKLGKFIIMTMFRTVVPTLALAWILSAGLGQAIDIDPSKNPNPNNPNLTTGSGTHFDIFSGDPTRIQRANTINFADIQATLETSLNQVSLYSIKEEGLQTSIRVTFKVKNNNPKRTYTLSFPNTQRYEFLVRDSSGQIVYKWSNDKKFVDTVGTTMVNPGDVLGYDELIPVTNFYSPLNVGQYTIEATLANYPQVTTKTTFQVVSGQPEAPAAGTASSNQ